MGAHLARAGVLYSQRRYEDALRELAHELGDDPESAPAHALAALALSDLGRHREALASARAAVRADAESAYPHYVLSRVCHAAGRRRAALRAIETALAIESEDADHHAQHAAVLFDLGRKKRALASAERGLALDPEHVGCLNLRSMALTGLGRRSEAHAGIDAALALDPDWAFSHANRGWTCLHALDPRAAIGHFAEALRLDPTDDSARAGLVEALKARNPIYGLWLAWLLFAGRLSLFHRWALVIGFAVVVVMTRHASRGDARLASLAVVAGGLYGLLFWMKVAADPLFDLFLLFDRKGRRALTDRQSYHALALGGTMASVLFAAGMTAALGGGIFEVVMFGFAGFTLGLPLHAAARMEGRLVQTLIVGLPALLLAGAVVLNRVARPQELGPKADVARAEIAFLLVLGVALWCLLATPLIRLFAWLMRGCAALWRRFRRRRSPAWLRTSHDGDGWRGGAWAPVSASTHQRGSTSGNPQAEEGR